MRKQKAIEAASGPIVEALEGRQLMSVSLEGSVVVVTGTSGNDDVEVNVGMRPDWSHHAQGLLAIRVNRDWTYFDPEQVNISGIRMELGDGNDLEWVSSNVWAIPMTVLGGAGRDTILGSGADDVIDGGAGQDAIVTSGGNDIVTDEPDPDWDDRWIMNRDDELLGSAWLDDDGIVHLVASDADNEIWIGRWGADTLYVAVDTLRMNFALADVRGFDVDCGAGNDNFSFWSDMAPVPVPVTVHGGAGDDVLCGQDWLNNCDSPLVHRSDGPFAPITIYGDAGNDQLGYGIGEVFAYGGSGNDTFYDSIWAKTTITDDVSGGNGTLVINRPARGTYVTYSLWAQGTLVAVPLSNGAKEMVWEDMLWTVPHDQTPAPAPQPQPAPQPEPEPALSGEGDEHATDVVVTTLPPSGGALPASPWSTESVAGMLLGRGGEESVWG
jgi:Ca2+-binding RTX toxin-like protein